LEQILALAILERSMQVDEEDDRPGVLCDTFWFIGESGVDAEPSPKNDVT
jgi:hypothetical protein